MIGTGPRELSMFEKLLRSILALLLVGCPYVCGQCGVACAREAIDAGVTSSAEAVCASPCCANHGPASSSEQDPGQCPCESVGVCICDGAVMENVAQEDRQPTVESLAQLVMAEATLDAAALAAQTTYVPESPPGFVTSGRDVRTWCASFLL